MGHDDQDSWYMRLHRSHDSWHSFSLIYGVFAARMITGAHIAIAGHFFATCHFSIVHGSRRQARKHGCARPQQRQNDEHETAYVHKIRVTLFSSRSKIGCNVATNYLIWPDDTLSGRAIKEFSGTPQMVRRTGNTVLHCHVASL
jgi:hypothetical protein